MRLFVFCLLMLALLPLSARAAPEEQDALSASAPAQGKPQLAGLPVMERHGDDLIIHYRPGDEGVTLAGYMKDVSEGQTKIVSMQIDGHGRCFIALDSAGSIIRAKCDQ